METILKNELIREQAKRLLAKRTYARKSFFGFCLWMDEDFFTRRPFLKEIALTFQWLYEEYEQGRAVKVSASLPPRSGKSYLTSLFCAWFLAKRPEEAVMRNTVTSSLYRKFSYDIRNMLRDRKYQAIFPHVILSPDKQNIDGWSLITSKQGAYFGGGVGTNIIGFGANLAITDDLYSGFEQALSIVYNDSVLRWKQGSHNSRMEKNCAEIYIGTRWSMIDAIGRAIEEKQIDREISIPALTEENKSFCEDVKSTEEYLKIKDETEDMIFAAEYMQQPIEAVGLLFPISELRFYEHEMLEADKVDFKFMYIDPANFGSDYFASASCSLVGKDILVEHVFCNKQGSEINNILHSEYILKNKINTVEYEGVFAWIETGKKLRRMVESYEDCQFRIVSPTTNKQTRILVQSIFIKNHFMFRSDYERMPEYKKFMQLLFTYMKDQRTHTAVNDDPPDCLSGVAAYFNKNFSHLW